MNADGWREINNAGNDYLYGKKSFTVLVTRLKNKNTKTYKAMYAWCRKNVKGSWGPSSLAEYDYFITWRFFRDYEAASFQEKFKRYIKEKQLLTY